MTDMIGAIGSILLAGCSLPQVYQCYRSKTAAGVNFSFILTWWLGLIFTMIYVFIKHGIDPYLHTVYLTNILTCSIILGYKIRDNNAN